jgi:hypothetical protein
MAGAGSDGDDARNELTIRLKLHGPSAGPSSSTPQEARRSFNPGWAVGLGFDDLKVIEAGQFLQAIVSGIGGPPSFEDAAAVARVQQAIAASWDSGGWQTVGANES